MNITLLVDGTPGHEKQSFALSRALQDILEVNIEQIAVDSVSLSRRIVDFGRLKLFPNGGCRYSLRAPDLILGTGSKTHIPLLSCKKKYGVPAVTCMAPDRYLRHMFDLCFVPRHDDIESSDTIFLTDGPPVLPVPELARDKRAGLILLGGVDPRSHSWSTADILSYVKTITTTSENISWKISSSPRTPEETIEAVAAFAQSQGNATFYNYHDTPGGWVEEQYAIASEVWVTVDSMSMVYEALTAGCQVGLLPLDWKKKQNKFRRSIETLLERRLVISYQTWEKGEASWQKTAVFNEAKRCADEIVSRWFKKS